MIEVERQLDRTLTLLRNKIRQRGYTQLEVQEVLGWGRSYISQLLTKQKSLRVEQVLLILNVIGVEPEAFFAELYPPGSGAHLAHQITSDSSDFSDSALHNDYRGVRSLLRGLVDLLVHREIITTDELSAAVHISRPLPSTDD